MPYKSLNRLKANRRKYYEGHREEILNRMAEYRLNHLLEIRKKDRERSSKFRKTQPDKSNSTSRAWRSRNPHRVRDMWLRRAYGITSSQFEVLKKNQKGTCAIPGCGQSRNLQVDHNHSSGRIRGLICRRHNLALGGFKDSLQELQAAIRYLNTYA